MLFIEAQAEDRYAVEAVYHESEQALTVSLDVSYTNRTGQALDSVSFNVYANVFRRESTLPYDNATLEKAFPYGYAPSGIEFTGVAFNGKPARYSFFGSNECYMNVRCHLEDGESGVFHFDYALLLSQNRSFQGCGEDLRLTLFYPSVCVWDGGFVYEPTSRATAFLYAEKADFDMMLYLPEGYRVASGALTAQKESEDGYELFELRLDDASELALTASRRYYTYEAALPSGKPIRVQGSVRSLCREALRQAQNAGSVYEALFGELPYERIDIAFGACCTDLCAPGLIVLSEENEALDELRIGYLLAQQYFGCAVYSDPQVDPFLRYGISCYAALLALRQSEGYDAFIDALTERIQPSLKMTVPGGLTPDSALTRFNTIYDFETVVKNRGAAVLYELGVSMGEEPLWAGLKRYYQQNQNGIATIERFVAALDEGREHTIGNSLVAWLMTIDDYALHEGDIYR
ncbi:MAG: hypothetical protein IJU28_07675 [Clostridia bacterium]|nr:hypothetical protein [Clostridia bacterium]